MSLLFTLIRVDSSELMLTVSFKEICEKNALQYARDPQGHFGDKEFSRYSHQGS